MLKQTSNSRKREKDLLDNTLARLFIIEKAVPQPAQGGTRNSHPKSRNSKNSNKAWDTWTSIWAQCSKDISVGEFITTIRRFANWELNIETWFSLHSCFKMKWMRSARKLKMSSLEAMTWPGYAQKLIWSKILSAKLWARWETSGCTSSKPSEL